MNRNFNDFLEFATSHNKEITEDIVSTMQHAYNDDLTVSQSDVTLITKIAIQSAYAILRQYHHWQDQED